MRCATDEPLVFWFQGRCRTSAPGRFLPAGKCPKRPFTSRFRKSSAGPIPVSRGCGPVRERNACRLDSSKIRSRGSSEFFYLDIKAKNSKKPMLQAILRRHPCPAYPAAPRYIERLCHLHFVGPWKGSVPLSSRLREVSAQYFPVIDFCGLLLGFFIPIWGEIDAKT